MVEHYAPEVIKRTVSLYSQVLEWSHNRDDVTIIGGWAVHHHVKDEHAMQSRDVNLVLHTAKALRETLANLNNWNLTLRAKGRKKFPDAHFKDEDPMVFRLDLFTVETNQAWVQTFGREGHRNIKGVPRGLFPSLEWILRDKLGTIPLRVGSDAADKRAKDLIDVYNLVFNNKENRTARRLLQTVGRDRRKQITAYLADAVANRPEYRNEIETLAQWLES